MGEKGQREQRNEKKEKRLQVLLGTKSTVQHVCVNGVAVWGKAGGENDCWGVERREGIKRQMGNSP